MNFRSLFISICLAFTANSVFAIEDDEIRGEVLAIDEQQRQMKIEILETGDAVKAKVGAAKTFMVSEAVEIEVELEDRRFQPNVAFQFADLSAGDVVLFDFDTQATPGEVIRIRAEKPRDMQMRKRTEGHDMKKKHGEKDTTMKEDYQG